VVERLRELIDARVVAIALPTLDGLRVEAIAADEGTNCSTAWSRTPPRPARCSGAA
jgi:hypothetical protein